MALSYKVFPGTPYYSNTTLTTKAGEIVNTTDATYVNTTYGTVSVGGSTYYVAYGMMVSFWNSSFNGQQIEDAITKVRAASATPASGGTDLFTTGGAYALKTAAAAKADLTSIIQTGTTCTEANGIAAGVYFYLNGDLVCAKTAIANGVTFTLNTNYEVPTAGALNALKSAFAWKLLGTVTGQTPISLPSNYTELYAFRNGGASLWARFVIIPKLALLPNATNYFYGGEFQSGNTGSCLGIAVDTTNSTVYLAKFYVNTEDRTSSSVLTVLYR